METPARCHIAPTAPASAGRAFRLEVACAALRAPAALSGCTRHRAPGFSTGGGLCGAARAWQMAAAAIC